MVKDYILEAEDRQEYCLLRIGGKINLTNVADVQQAVGKAVKMGHKQF